MFEPVLLIDKLLNKIKYICLLAGINIKLKKTRNDEWMCWSLYIFNFIWVTSDIVGAMFWLIDGIVKNKSLIEITYVAPCAFGACLADIKSVTMFMNRHTVDVLIDKLRELENQQKGREENAETEEIIKKEDRYINKVIKGLNIIYMALTICFSLNPAVLMLLKYVKTNEVELLLPLQILYPFDSYDIKYYPWVYIHHIWSVVVVAIGFFVADGMFNIACAYLRTQFLLLSYYIENLIPPESKERYDAKACKIKLLQLIQWHQQIISIVDVVDALFTKSTLCNFVSSSALICLTGFNVMMIDDVGIVLMFLSYFMMSLMQIFFQCFFGDLLMESVVYSFSCVTKLSNLHIVLYWPKYILKSNSTPIWICLDNIFHKKVCLVDVMEELFTKPTLINFVSSSILICLTGFNVVAIDDMAIVLTFLCFLLMNLLQIFFQCFFGDLLMESSMAVGDAVYNSRWYLADKGLKQTMFLILVRAQTPCKLTALKFSDVNLNAFMTICSTAWSYFALLQTLYQASPE